MKHHRIETDKSGKWLWGEQRRLAEALGVSEATLSNILARKSACDPALARCIEELTNKQITIMDLLYRDTTKNPLLL